MLIEKYNINMWFLPAFCSAILGAIDVLLNKKCLNSVSAGVLTWALFTLSLPLIAYIALKNGIPSINNIFLFGVIGSSITFVISKTLMNNTIKHSMVSQVYPLTSFNGLFIYVLGLLFLSESIRSIPVIGLLSVILGSYILNADKANGDFLRPFKLLLTNKTSLLFLFAILLNGITSLFDKVGIINLYPANPAFVLLVENIFMVIALTIYLHTKEKNRWVMEVKSNFSILFLNSIIYSVSSLLVFSAFTGGPIALVMGVKRLQIFFILLFGGLLLKDKPTKHAWIASIIMVIGIMLIKLG